MRRPEGEKFAEGKKAAEGGVRRPSILQRSRRSLRARRPHILKDYLHNKLRLIKTLIWEKNIIILKIRKFFLAIRPFPKKLHTIHAFHTRSNLLTAPALFFAALAFETFKKISSEHVNKRLMKLYTGVQNQTQIETQKSHSPDQ